MLKFKGLLCQSQVFEFVNSICALGDTVITG